MSRAGVFASARHGGAAEVPTFRNATQSGTDATSYTFAAQPIGPASATRRVVVAIAGRTTALTLTSVTIGGVTATTHASQTSGTNKTWIVSAVVPTGTTADVVVTFGGATATRCGIGVWTLPSGSYAGQNASGSGTDPIALTVTTAAGQFVIAVCSWVETSGSAAWTLATERYDQINESTVYHSGADYTAVGSSSAISVSAATDSCACAAAFSL